MYVQFTSCVYWVARNKLTKGLGWWNVYITTYQRDFSWLVESVDFRTFNLPNFIYLIDKLTHSGGKLFWWVYIWKVELKWWIKRVTLKILSSYRNWIIVFLWKWTGWFSFTLYKKWSFLLRVSSVNVTKSAGNFGFGHIYWGKP